MGNIEVFGLKHQRAPFHSFKSLIPLPSAEIVTVNILVSVLPDVQMQVALHPECLLSSTVSVKAAPPHPLSVHFSGRQQTQPISRGTCKSSSCPECSSHIVLGEGEGTLPPQVGHGGEADEASALY